MKALPVFFSLVLFLGACFPLEVYASDSQIGGEIQVLAYWEGGRLYEGNGSFASPSGKRGGFEILNGQGRITAWEIGEWEISVGGGQALASVYDEPARQREIEGREDGFWLFAILVSGVFSIGLFGLAFLFKREIRKGMKGGGEREVGPGKERILKKLRKG